MPPYSKLQTFVDALKTGETNITRSLDRLINDPQKRRDHSDFVKKVNAFSSFPDWLRTELAQAGMSTDEINHIERWPNEEKEQVRIQIVDAIQENRPLRFGWELYEGGRPTTDVRREPGRDARVVFRSPRAGVRVHGDEVHVDE
jgi:hypothetical protein